MPEKESIKSKTSIIIFIIVILIVLYILYSAYKLYYYNDFSKAELNSRQTVFIRDNKIKYSNDRSYKVESKNYNDAMFYKSIKVTPNTPYKVTCMIKTENVETEKQYSSCGAQIGLVDSTECSKSIIGTNDWQPLEFIFNSKSNEEIKIGFRLGGNTDNAKGTVWFSDLKIEEGITNQNNNWHMACFIFKNIELKTQDYQNIKLQISLKEIENIKIDMSRFQTACKELSNRTNDNNL